MNKIKRMIAALMLCVMALSCAGCARLDEMKETHGIFLDEQGWEIQLNGKVYKAIPKANLEIINYSNKSVDVTQPDVPVLLKEQFGKSAGLSKDEAFLEGHWSAAGENPFYCRADRYEVVMKEINEGPTLSEITYDYWEYASGENKLYVLTADQRAAVQAVMETTPEILDGYEEDYSARLAYTSKSLLFRKGLGYISVWQGNYRLIESKDGLDYGYTVPQEMVPIFKEMMKPYQDATQRYY